MWTTRDKLEYLDTIGQYADSAIVKDLSRREMLRSYLKAAAQRSEWGLVSQTVVTLRAEALLAELEG